MARKLVVQMAMTDGSTKSINIANPRSGLYQENAGALVDSAIENSIFVNIPIGLVKAYYEETTVTELVPKTTNP